MVTYYSVRAYLLFTSLLITMLLGGCASNPEYEATPGASTNSPISINGGGTCDESDVTKLASPALTDPLGANAGGGNVPTAPVDLWERVRLGFRLEIPNDWRVRRELTWLTANPEELESGARRAEPYLHFIVEEAEKRKMPMEIALLPVVESGFRPHARSNKQAAGLWQFIPSTAKTMGLKQNWWYEGRCDVMASTRAALDYLQELADQFHGNWELALAAYNAGPGRVQRAIQSNQDKGLATDFWSLPLPDETRKYVPRLLAIARIFKDPKYHGVNLRPLANTPYFSEVKLSRPIALSQAASLAHVDQATLTKLNPGLRRGMAGLGGNHPLLLPVGQAAQFEKRLANMATNPVSNLGSQDIQTNNGSGTLASVLTSQNPTPIDDHSGNSHVVRPGESLTGVARVYHLDIARLADWNNLSPNAELKRGQVLRLYALTDIAKAKPITYKVQKGDSLLRIAQRFRVSIADLRRWNHLYTDTLIPGRRLTLLVVAPLTSSL